MDTDTNSKTEAKAVYRQELFAGALIMGLMYSLAQIIVYTFNIKGGDYNWIFFVYGIAVIATVQTLFGRKVASARPANRGFSYGSSLGFMVLMSMLSGVIVGIVGYLIMNVIDPAYGESIYRQAYEQAAAMMPNATEEQLDAGMAMSRFMSGTIWGLIMSNVFGMLLNGGFVGLITSAFVKRNADFFAQNEQ